MAALFSKPKLPEVKPVAPLPDEEGVAYRESQKRRTTSILGGAGAGGGRRAAVDLGGDYSSVKFGARK